MICPAQRVWKLLEREILHQFAADGGNKEQALHYHLFAWEMSWHAGLAAGGLKGEVLERLTKDESPMVADAALWALAELAS